MAHGALLLLLLSWLFFAGGGRASGPGETIYLPLLTGLSPMMIGEGGYRAVPLLTVGETVSGTTGARNSHSAGAYTPPGKLDGLGAMALDAGAVRLFANHELGAAQGYPYFVDNGIGGTVSLTGARISYIDINLLTGGVEDAGLAYGAIYDRRYDRVTSASQLDTPDGLARLCSASLYKANTFGPGRGLADPSYLTGEEAGIPTHPHGGSIWALDVAAGALWAAPELGRGAWENVTLLDAGDTGHVALLLSDDTPGAPLYLYVGEKGAVGDGSFLDDNGLKQGQLYFWRSLSGERDPSDFNTGGTLEGVWAPLAVRDPVMANEPGFDAEGYKDSDTLHDEVDARGGFSFSRPEDVATNPVDATQAVLASTGYEGLFGGADQAGTLYLVEVNFTNIASPTGSLSVLYDGDADPGRSLRNPDNLDWSGDGWIYVQEDRATAELFGEGAANPHEASVLRVDPATGALNRVAAMNRAAVPPGQTDYAPLSVGAWESSGVVDVSELFGLAPGMRFLFDVQAHSVGGGPVSTGQLVEGGQLLWLVGSGPGGAPQGETAP